MKNALIIAVVICALVAACGPAPAQTAPTTAAPTAASTANTCTTEQCFIPLANDCKEASLTLQQAAGTFSYTVKDCVLTKTLVSLKPDEAQDMKDALQGKSMTCKYEQGKFDTRWTDSLLGGMELCQGELRDVLGNLLMFV
jgi:nitrous oxide reductase accessory protein NosL